MNKKRFFAWIIVLALILNSMFIDNISVSASNDKIDVYFTCEKSVIGQGLIVEPCKISVEKNTKVSKVLDKIFDDNNIEYKYSGTLNSGFYLSGIKNCDDGTFNIPSIIKNSDVYNRRVSKTNTNAPDIAERSFIGTSGWFYFVNNSAPNVGMSEYELSDGDVVRIQFTLFNYGDDLKIPANRDKLIKKLASNKKNECYDEGIKVLQNLDKDKDDISDVIEKINKANEKESESGNNHKETSSDNGNQNNDDNNHGDNNHNDDNHNGNNNNDTNHNNSGNGSGNNGGSHGSNNSGSHGRNRRPGNSNSNNGNRANNNQNTSNGNGSNENVNNNSNSNSNQENTDQTNSNSSDVSNDQNNNQNDNKTSENNTNNLEDNSKNKNDSNDGNENNDYVIGIAGHESKEVKELLDEEHINKIDEEIDEYKNRIEEIDLSDGGALQMQWEMISLMTSGREIDSKFFKKYIDTFNSEIKSTSGSLSNKGTDYSKAVISMSALGLNHNDYEFDLTEKLKDKDLVCSQGINGPMWALMALSSSNDFNGEYDELKKDYYEILKSEWNDKKCFSLMDDNGDVDLTAMAVLAGSLYCKNMECDKKFLADATSFIEKEADSNGEFKSMGNTNVESLSYATMALLSVRDKSYDFNRAVDNILSYKTKDGLFAHLYDEKGTDKGNVIATQQAMLALCMISNAYHTNSDKLFYYADNNSDNVNVKNINGSTESGNIDSTSESESKVKENNKKNGNYIKCIGLVFIGLLALCFLCACLYLLLRAVRNKKESR